MQATPHLSTASRRSSVPARRRVVVIGAGVGGLVASLLLASRGFDVVVCERALTPGGKLREIEVADGARVDSGPTVFTLRGVFEEIFAAANASLDDHIRLAPLEVLARHGWSENQRLDLLADEARSADAIAAFAGPDEGRRYRAFCARARRIFRTLEHSFIRDSRPTPIGLTFRVGLTGLPDLWSIAPFERMWTALGHYFHDPRLRQLFGRYATYCGASPYDAAATLMLVAHVEQAGVWTVEGGMYRLVTALERLANARGVAFRYGTEVREIVVAGGEACGVVLADGERITADAVIANADVAAVSSGRFGAAAAQAVTPAHRRQRSLSAVTWSMQAQATGFPLAHHNVFFGADYAREFADIFQRAQLPVDPTVYVCAADRSVQSHPQGTPERLFLLVNAPATGDTQPFHEAEIQRCEERTFRVLERCGLRVAPYGSKVVTTPNDFERLFPATGGALYGEASHGWAASFRRADVRTRLPGLFLAGGSTHPGPGVPMAALSGRRAAESVAAALGSKRQFLPVAMPGGISTP